MELKTLCRQFCICLRVATAGDNVMAYRTHAVSEAMDKINDRWGEFVITPALMMGMENITLDRIAFGGVKKLEKIYSDELRTI